MKSPEKDRRWLGRWAFRTDGADFTFLIRGVADGRHALISGWHGQPGRVFIDTRYLDRLARAGALRYLGR